MSPSLSIGVAESARYDAAAPELLYLLNLFPYTVLERFSLKHRERTPEPDQRNNVMMAGDLVWRFREGGRLWAELLLDDVATELGDMPHRLAWQAGVSQHTRIGGAPGRIELEYTKVFRFTYAVSYGRNHILGERPLGFAGGPDSESYSLRVTADPAPEWSVTVDAGLLRGGEGFLGESWDPNVPLDPWSGASLTGVVESTVSLVPSVAWIPRDNVRVRAGVGVRRSTNADHVRGRTETDPEGFLELQVTK
jgi:hypothetical protein